MMRYVLLSLLSIFIISCECDASTTQDKECYTLDDIMKDHYMKGAETCKLSEGFCIFTSNQKAIGGDMNYSYSQQIPCKHFETYKAIRKCTIEHQDIPQKSERYMRTRDCIKYQTNS